MSKIRKISNKLLGKDKTSELEKKLSDIYIYKFKKYKNTKKIIYTLVPTHGNLGDQAIAYASRKYLKDNFSEYEVIEINCEDSYKYTNALKNIVKKDDLIFLHGGGNMGNHYIPEEEARRHIINTFPNNKIISFTQTMYFSNDEEGRRELKKTKEVYDSHKDFTIIAREDKSYDIMKKTFENVNIIKYPDIVFYLNNKLNNKNYERVNIMTCLRKDKETYVSQDKKEIFLNKLKENYSNIIISDTKIKESVYKDEREVVLFKLWSDFYKSEVVITDRLHGMIFCAITKTPCIVTRSLDHKVLESYKWIKNLNHIRLVDGLEFEKIKPIIEELRNINVVEEFDLDTNYFNVLKNNII